MKVVLLAGGRGTRISEETQTIPKPMVEIGGKPILWHIMKLYSHYGFNEFIICLGYLGYVIKEYFYHYFMHMSDVTVDLEKNAMQVHSSASEPWKVTLVDTGLDAMTGGRLKRVGKYLDGDTFLMTYGDGVGDVDIKKVLAFHKSYKKMATVTAVQPMGRFGSLDIDEDGKVTSFMEKPRGDHSWINAGFFVLEPAVLDFIKNDQTLWEKEPLEILAQKKELAAYKHAGFWKPMDTLRDKNELERLWQIGEAPWKVW